MGDFNEQAASFKKVIARSQTNPEIAEYEKWRERIRLFAELDELRRTCPTPDDYSQIEQWYTTCRGAHESRHCNVAKYPTRSDVGTCNPTSCLRTLRPTWNAHGQAIDDWLKAEAELVHGHSSSDSNVPYLFT